MTAVKNRGLISSRWLLEHKKYYYFPSAAAAAFVFDFVVFDELFARIKPRGGKRERKRRKREIEKEKSMGVRKFDSKKF